MKRQNTGEEGSTPRKTHPPLIKIPDRDLCLIKSPYHVDINTFRTKQTAKNRKSTLITFFMWGTIATIVYFCTGSFGTSIVVLIAVPVSFLLVITILSFTIGKPFTARGSSFFIPRAMKSIDELFTDVRTELLKNVHGDVLDVGCGDGPYLKYYATSRYLKNIVFLEPNVFQHPLLQQNITRMTQQHPQTLGKISTVIEHRFIEDLTIDSSSSSSSSSSSFSSKASPSTRSKRLSNSRVSSPSFDWIILGNVLCEVPDQESVIQHVDRLLKPGGSFFFSEHIAHPPHTWGRWLQEFVNPWWCCVSDGCNINRPTLETLNRLFNQYDFGDQNHLRKRAYIIDHDHVTGLTHMETSWGDIDYWKFDVHGMPFVLGVATKSDETDISHRVKNRVSRELKKLS